jgi:hypothetical protein
MNIVTFLGFGGLEPVGDRRLEMSIPSGKSPSTAAYSGDS